MTILPVPPNFTTVTFAFYKLHNFKNDIQNPTELSSNSSGGQIIDVQSRANMLQTIPESVKRITGDQKFSLLQLL